MQDTPKPDTRTVTLEDYDLYFAHGVSPRFFTLRLDEGDSATVRENPLVLKYGPADNKVTLTLNQAHIVYMERRTRTVPIDVPADQVLEAVKAEASAA